MRLGLNSDLGFSEKDRNENIRRIGEVCLFFFTSLCSTLYPCFIFLHLTRSPHLTQSTIFGQRPLRCDADNHITKRPCTFPSFHQSLTSQVAKLFADSCTIALTSFISPFRKDRDAARALHAKTNNTDSALPFIEVFIDIPVEEAEKRDPKGLYKKARAGLIPDFTGISAPYEEPLHPEIHIKSHETSVEDAVVIIEKYLVEKGLLARGKKA